MDAHSREFDGAVEGMAEVYGRSLVGVTVWFNGSSIPHGREGVVVEQDAAARSLVVVDDGGERHAIDYSNLLPW